LATGRTVVVTVGLNNVKRFRFIINDRSFKKKPMYTKRQIQTEIK